MRRAAVTPRHSHDILLYTEGQEETPATVPRVISSLTSQCTARTKYNGWRRLIQNSHVQNNKNWGIDTYTQAETINVQLNTQTRMKDTTNTRPVCYGEWSCRNQRKTLKVEFMRIKGQCRNFLYVDFNKTFSFSGTEPWYYTWQKFSWYDVRTRSNTRTVMPGRHQTTHQHYTWQRWGNNMYNNVGKKNICTYKK